MTQCPSDIPSAQELAQTPRKFEDLELLALKFSSGIVADQAVYDRIVRNVTSARSLRTELASIGFTATNDGRTLLLTVDEPTAKAIQAGTYAAWSCLNDAYGASEPHVDLIFNKNYVGVTLRGIYDLKRVGAQYAALPGIQAAEPGIGGLDGPTICLTRDAETWHYVFDDASGDCPSGCIDHVYTHFTSLPTGVVTYAGTPSAAELRSLAPRDACH
jgi:hypothetical protein